MKTTKIIDVKALPEKKLYLKFSDGLEGIFCFCDYFIFHNLVEIFGANVMRKLLKLK